MHDALVVATAEFVAPAAEEDEGGVCRGEELFGDVFAFFNEARDGDGGSGVDGTLLAFVVEADVAADDGDVEEFAGICHAGDDFFEHVEGFGFVGVAEVEVIGHAERSGSGAGEVAHAFGEGDLTAAVGVQVAVTVVAVVGEGDEFLFTVVETEADDGGVTTGFEGGASHDHVVVLFPDPAFLRDGRFGEEFRKGTGEESFVWHGEAVWRPFVSFCDVSGSGGGAVVNGGFIREFFCRDVDNHFAVLFDYHATRVGDETDFGGV